MPRAEKQRLWDSQRDPVLPLCSHQRDIMSMWKASGWINGHGEKGKSSEEIRKPGMVPGLGLWQDWVRNYLSASCGTARAEQSWDKWALTGDLMTNLLSSRMAQMGLDQVTPTLPILCFCECRQRPEGSLYLNMTHECIWYAPIKIKRQISFPLRRHFHLPKYQISSSSFIDKISY